MVEIAEGKKRKSGGGGGGRLNVRFSSFKLHGVNRALSNKSCGVWQACREVPKGSN